MTKLTTMDKIDKVINPNSDNTLKSITYDYIYKTLYLTTFNNIIIKEKNFNYMNLKKYVESKSTDYYTYLKSYNSTIPNNIDIHQNTSDFFNGHYHQYNIGFGYCPRILTSLNIKINIFNKSQLITIVDKYEITNTTSVITSNGHWNGNVWYYDNCELHPIKLYYNSHKVFDNNTSMKTKEYIVGAGVQMPSPLYQYEYNDNTYYITYNKDIRSKGGIISIITNDATIYNQKNILPQMAQLTNKFDISNSRYADAIVDIKDQYLYFLSINGMSPEDDGGDTLHRYCQTYLYKIDITQNEVSDTFTADTSDIITLNDGETLSRNIMSFTNKVTELSSDTIDGRILFYSVWVTDDDNNNHLYIRAKILNIDYGDLNVTKTNIDISQNIEIFIGEQEQKGSMYTTNIMNTEYDPDTGLISMYIISYNEFNYYLFELNDDNSQLELKDNIRIETNNIFPICYIQNKTLIFIINDKYYKISNDYDNKSIIVYENNFYSSIEFDSNDRARALSLINGYIMYNYTNVREPYKYDHGHQYHHQHLTAFNIRNIDYEAVIDWDQDSYEVEDIPFNVSGKLHIYDDTHTEIAASVEMHVIGGTFSNGKTEKTHDVSDTGLTVSFIVEDPENFKVNTYILENNN